MYILDDITVMQMQHERLAASLRRLDSLVDFQRANRSNTGPRYDVSQIKDLLHRLGQPQRRFQSIHVTGSKGKGSVCALVEAALIAASIPCGRYSSPHVEHPTERLTINGREVDDLTLSQTIDAAWEAREASLHDGTAGQTSTWFDVMTAAAFLALAKARVFWAVVEVGIGGRLDSTNTVDAPISVITNVVLEHTEILGSTLGAIARDKAGIVRPGSQLITAVPRASEAGAAIMEVCEPLNVSPTFVHIPLGRSIETTNVVIASAVLEAMKDRGVVVSTKARIKPVGGWLLDAKTIGLARLPGRMELIRVRTHEMCTALAPGETDIVLDGAHVPSSLAAVLRDLQREGRDFHDCTVLLALGKDKDANTIADELSKYPLRVIATTFDGGPPVHTPDSLSHTLTERGVSASAMPDPHRGLDRALVGAHPHGWVLVTGSLYLVGKLRTRINAYRI